MKKGNDRVEWVVRKTEEWFWNLVREICFKSGWHEIGLEDERNARWESKIMIQH